MTTPQSINRLRSSYKGRPESAYFCDEQVQGPFALWKHDHWFTTTSNGGTCLKDRFTYAAPFGRLGKLAEQFWLNRRMRRLLEYMQTAEKRLLEMEEADASQPDGHVL